jgi:uncharacterized OB-fold protein
VHRSIAAGQELPFVIAVIALEDAGGVRIISNLVDANPDELESEEFSIPRFRPRRPQHTSKETLR